ncbi:choline dehydrogenase [Leeia sp. TBRC 13508]|uniref:Choline dehydrogenase n=1 Tax=Leeia speluncae TaxID=2884804 RepID=A0ABS8D8Y6_9NEIS|nr:choline dehydrogenase [Leeia speluncae]MCB6184687.1 choline dehydrogenase [Leeia speluncae]
MQDLHGRKLKSVYDYIVVGSGSAGSVLAARLAESGQYSVLLLEAGKSDNVIYIKMPAALGIPLQDDKYNWFLHSEEEPGLNNRKVLEARGKTLGGSSSINGMNWVRGNPWDYDNWAALGNSGWSYKEVLPYFKRSETFDKGENQYRGGAGPMKIETCKAKGALYDAFIKSAMEAGYQYIEDANAYKQEGVHITQRNVHKGLRWSTSRGYIHAAGPKENLHVVTEAYAQKIKFVNKRADKLVVSIAGVEQEFHINKEIISCAGALHTPHLLLHSGIGDQADLKKVGVNVVHHLPGVGRGLKDHVAAPVQYSSIPGSSSAGKLSALGRLKIGIQWIFAKKGLGATNFFEVGAFCRTSEEVKVPDVQFEFVPFLGDFQHGKLKLSDGFQYFFSLMRPKSEGRVWIESNDPKVPPKFVFNYLTHEEDVKVAVAAVKEIRRVIAHDAWKPVRQNEVLPGAHIQTDEQIVAFLRDNAGTNYHPCCTCRMGSDEMAVTDHEAKVHGLDNVRIVDASIMPEIVSGNLNAPIIMMAEKVSDLILGKRPLAAADADYYKL